MPAGMFDFGMTEIPMMLLVVWYTLLTDFTETIGAVFGMSSSFKVFDNFDQFLNFVSFGLILGVAMSHFKKRSIVFWGFLCGAFPPFVLWLVFLPKVHIETQEVVCPHCGKNIKNIKTCEYCGKT